MQELHEQPRRQVLTHGRPRQEGGPAGARPAGTGERARPGWAPSVPRRGLPMPTPTCPPSRTPKWHKHRVRSSEPHSSPRHHLHPLPCDQPCGPKPPGHQGQLFLLPDVPPPLHTRPLSRDALCTPSPPSTPSLHPLLNVISYQLVLETT